MTSVNPLTQFKPETLAAIERAVPDAVGSSAIDIWRACGCTPSHQHVKNALKRLYEQGKVLRRSERHEDHHRFVYSKVSK
jgi:hypothetical protein